METKDLKRLSLLPDEMLTPRLVALAQEILRYHDCLLYTSDAADD